VFDAKGLAELVVAGFGLPSTTRLGGVLPGFEPDSHATLLIGDTVVGEFGEVSASARAAWGIEVPVFAAALRLDGALPVARARRATSRCRASRPCSVTWPSRSASGR